MSTLFSDITERTPQSVSHLSNPSNHLSCHNVGNSGPSLEEQRAIQLAFELSMLGLTTDPLNQSNQSSATSTANTLMAGLSTADLLAGQQSLAAHLQSQLHQTHMNGSNGQNMNGNGLGLQLNGFGGSINGGSSLNSPTDGMHMNPFNGMLPIQMDDRSKKSQNMTECVPVPSSEHVAEIVGRQGCKIKALRAKTNTYIKTPVRGEEPVFVVTGRKEDVAKAKREILSAAEHFSLIRASRKPTLGGLSAKGTPPGPPINIPGQITIQVRVPYRVVGLVVGPKGATIKHIQQQTHTYIVTPSRDKEPVFEVTGMPDNVQSARRQIEAHIALRTGNTSTGSMVNGAGNGNSNSGGLTGLIGDDATAPELLASLYQKGFGSLFGYLDSNGMNGMQNGGNGGLGQSCDPLGSVLSGIGNTMMPAGINSAGLMNSTNQMQSSTGSSTCPSSSSSTSSKSAIMTRPELINIWKNLGDLTGTGNGQMISNGMMGGQTMSGPITMSPSNGLDMDEGLGESPNIWSMPTSSVLGGSRSSPSESASPTDSLLAGSTCKRECLVCGDKEVTSALVPCGHNMFCMDCANRICSTGDSACPICSQTVMQAIRIIG